MLDVLHKRTLLIVASALALLGSEASISGGNRDGFFTTQTIGVFPHARDLAAADFNGDGDEDGVIVHGADPLTGGAVSAPRLLLQQGSQLLPLLGVGAARIGSRVEAADLNGDGWPDLVISGGDRNAADTVFPSQTAIFFNSGVWTNGQGFDFDAPLILSAAEYAPHLSLGDIDGDRDTDIAVASVTGGAGSTVGAVTLWINQGGAQGGTAGSFLPVSYQENAGPYGEITALRLNRLVLTGLGTDLVFARGSRVQIAVRDSSSSNGVYSTTIRGFDTAPALVNDLLVLFDNRIALALQASASAIYNVTFSGGFPTGFVFEQVIGTATQDARVLAPLAAGNASGAEADFALGADFDGATDTKTAGVGVYQRSLIGRWDSRDQCLLPEITTPLAIEGVRAQSGEPFVFADDLMVLTAESMGTLYRLRNNGTVSSARCCKTSQRYLAIRVFAEKHLSGLVPDGFGLPQLTTWLDSMNNLRTIRRDILPLTAGGQRYIGHYQQREAQLLSLFTQDPQIADAWFQLLSSWNDPIRAMAQGTDDQYILSATQMADLTSYLDLLRTRPGVGTVVSSELALIQPLSSYATGTLRAFMQDTVGLGTALVFTDGFEP